MNKFSAFVVTVTILVAPLAYPQAATSDKIVDVRFRTLGWDTSADDLNYSASSKDIPITLTQGARSLFFKYKGPASVVFYKTKTDSSGQKIVETIADADLSNGGVWPLVIFFKDPSKPGRMTTHVIPDDLTTFPAQAFEVVNFTNVQLDVAFNSDAFALLPKEIRIVKPKTRPDQTTVYFSLGAMVSGRKLPVFGCSWAIQENLRTIVFIVPSTENPAGIWTQRIVEGTVFPPEPKPDSDAKP